MRTEDGQRILQGRVVDGQLQPGGPPPDKPRHGGHGWMMIACCIPMLVIAGILVATGAGAPGWDHGFTETS